MRLCSIDGCSRKHKARGMCAMHYWRNWQQTHVEFVRERNRENERRQRATLGDSYVRSLLREKSPKTCATDGCERPHKARGLCIGCYQRQWHHDGPSREKRLEMARRWKREHPQRINENGRAYESRQRAALGDDYIKRLLGTRHADVPPVLIEAKRAQLQIHRLLRSYAWR